MEITDWKGNSKKERIASVGKGTAILMEFFHLPGMLDAVFVERYDKPGTHLFQLIKDGDDKLQFNFVSANVDGRVVRDSLILCDVEHEAAKEFAMECILRETIPKGDITEEKNKIHLREILSRVFA